jgi:hypothetical protein
MSLAAVALVVVSLCSVHFGHHECAYGLSGGNLVFLELIWLMDDCSRFGVSVRNSDFACSHDVLLAPVTDTCASGKTFDHTLCSH